MPSNYDANVRRLVNRLRVFLKVLFGHLAFPLRLVHYLCRTLVRLYYSRSSVASRRRFQRIHTEGHPERVAGSSQPPTLLPTCHNQLQVPPLLGPASCSSSPLLPVHAPSSSSNCVLQPPPAAPVSSQTRVFAECHPFTPSEVMRYDKSPSINPDNNTCMVIEALTRDYLDAHQKEGGDWHACVHPEGALYFHDPVRGIYTDSNLQSEDRRRHMNSCVEDLLALMPPKLQLDCNKIELVVQLARNQKSKVGICRYYLVDHDKHLLFWLHEIPTCAHSCG
ncbi:hypothetical protein EDB19DRAFT_1122344 [Suillus lakei]|nr:hypothetical protein EDB19DRAFT_1122344 [Suillus lakei]